MRRGNSDLIAEDRSGRSDLYWWLLAIMPTIAVMLSLFRSQALSIFGLLIGFAMLTFGSTRDARFIATIGRLALMSMIAAIGYWSVGFDIMYPSLSTDEYSEFTMYADLRLADRRMQTGFALTSTIAFSAAIASVALRLPTRLSLAVIFSCLVYPLVGRLKWGGGWLDEFGFVDFAGGTIVMALAGWFALGIAIVHRDPDRAEHVDPESRFTSSMRFASSMRFTGAVVLWFILTGSIGLFQSGMPEVTRAAVIANIACLCGASVMFVVGRVVDGNWAFRRASTGGVAGIAACLSGYDVLPEFSAGIVGCLSGCACVLGATLLKRYSVADPHYLISALTVGGVTGAALSTVYGVDGDVVTRFGVQVLGSLGTALVGFLSGVVISAVAKRILASSQREWGK